MSQQPASHASASNSPPSISAYVHLLEAAFHALPIGLSLHDRATGHQIKNRPHAELCQFTHAPTPGTAILDSRSGIQRNLDLIRREDLRVLEQGSAVDLPAVTYFHPDGRSSVHHVRKLPLRDAQGSIIGLLKIAEDITERYRTARELSAQHQLLKAVFDVMPVWVFVKDTERRYILVNRMMAEALGLAQPVPAAQLAKLALDVSPEDARRLEALDNRVLTTGETAVSAPLNITVPGQGVRLFRTLRAPLSAEDGTLRGIVGFAEDVTDRVRSEQALQQMQKMESLALLAGAFAHDFKNLLHTILVSGETVRSKLPPDSPLAPLLDNVDRAGHQAAELCGQVLSFAGKGEASLRSASLNALVRDTVAMLRSMLVEGIDLRLDLEEPLPTVCVDRTQLKQVLMNLVINAIQALPAGGGTIRLRTGTVLLDTAALTTYVREPSLAPGTFVRAQVIDTGCGMTPETASRVFDPFTPTKREGHGLGLAAALGIVRRHGGAIRVESWPGEGTTFDVLLPVEVLACTS